MRRGYEEWDADLGTAGEISEEEAALMLAAFEGGGLDEELGKSFFRRIGSAIKKVAKKVVKAPLKIVGKLGPAAALIPGAAPFAAAAQAFNIGKPVAPQLQPLPQIGGSFSMVGPEYLNQALANPFAAAQAFGQASNMLGMTQGLNYLQAGQQPKRLNFFQSLLSPLRQTAKLIPQMLSQGLQQRAQVEALKLQQSAMSKLLGFQGKVVGGEGSEVISAAELQRKAQQAAQLRTSESQALAATRLAEERERRRRDQDRQANIAARSSDIAANSKSDQIPRLPRPAIPKAGAQPPRPAPTAAAAFPIGAVALVAIVVLLWLAFRR